MDNVVYVYSHRLKRNEERMMKNFVGSAEVKYLVNNLIVTLDDYDNVYDYIDTLFGELVKGYNEIKFVLAGFTPFVVHVVDILRRRYYGGKITFVYYLKDDKGVWREHVLEGVN